MKADPNSKRSLRKRSMKANRKARQKAKTKSLRKGNFYQSEGWKQARYDAIKRHGARCQSCGNSPQTGAILNVDHIQPLSKRWDLRLDPDNLQVLCSACNWGKGSRDTTDWRHMREIVNERAA